MTASFHLNRLTASAAAEWNSADGDQVLDVALWFDRCGRPQRNVRLRYHHGELIARTALPAAAPPLPLAVIPPLVNAHTHLEFSSLPEPLQPSCPFTEWIGAVIRCRRNIPDPADAVAAGLKECSDAGVLGVGEITTSDAGHSALSAVSAGTVVSFRELTGFLPDRIDAQMTILQNHIRACRQTESQDRPCLPGISPHAPYSVHPELFRAAVSACEHHQVPLAVHLAETREERELLECGTGPFRSFLESLDLWHPRVLKPGTRIRSWLQELRRLRHALAIHCNYLEQDEIAFLGRHPQIAAVYCPRTHAFFGHAPHPWQKILAGGGTVILATDGRSSNPDLNLWKEVRFLAARAPSMSVETLLPMVTVRAADALGLSLHPAAATLIAIPHDSPEALLSAAAFPIGTLISRSKRMTLSLNGRSLSS